MLSLLIVLVYLLFATLRSGWIAVVALENRKFGIEHATGHIIQAKKMSERCFINTVRFSKEEEEVASLPLYREIGQLSVIIPRFIKQA